MYYSIRETLEPVAEPVIGEDDAQYVALSTALEGIGCRTLKPVIAAKEDESAELDSAALWRNS